MICIFYSQFYSSMFYKVKNKQTLETLDRKYTNF